MSETLEQWARDQRALASALGLSVDRWLVVLEAAGANRAGVTAAVIGASMARRLGMPNLAEVDGPALVETARALLDPEPPRVRHPVVAEAIRRADGWEPGRGARRLTRTPAARPDRAAPSDAPSSTQATADAPGVDE